MISVNDKVVWIAKRLSDVAMDIDVLSEEDKKEVIKRAEKSSPFALIELFNSLNEYGEL